MVFSMNILTHASPSQIDCFGPFKKNWANESYKVWDHKMSTTAIKTLVDRSTMDLSKHSRSGIMMGAAKITEDIPLHQHEETEIYYVLKGKGRTFLTTLQGRYTFDIEAGSFLYLPSRMPHYTKAHPGTPLELLYIFPQDSLGNVQYVFDGSLELSTESPIVGKLSLPKSYPSEVLERTLVDTRRKTETHPTGQVMKQFRMPTERQVDNFAASNSILFIRQGEGTINIHGENFPIQNGEYLYLEKGTSYSLQSGNSQGLDVLIFQ